MFLVFNICVTAIGFFKFLCSDIKVPVPRFAVGIVIGRNGEMIKKIQNDTGVRIQFKPGEGSRLLTWHSHCMWSMMKDNAPR